MATPEEIRRAREETAFGGILGDFFAKNRQYRSNLANEGRRPVLGGLLSKEPVMGTDTLRYEGFRPLIGNVLEPVIRSVDAPRAAAQNLIPPEDMNSEALNVAGILGGGSLAASGRGILDYDPNTVNIFAGQRAAARLGGDRRDNMAKAAEMFDAGVPERDIYNKTSVFKGADGKLRYEIFDETSTINPDRLGEQGLRLEDFLNHPELFEAYPTMRGIRVEAAPEGATYRGAYLPQSGRILINKNLEPDEMRSTTIHEGQHGVQDREGFSGGSSVDMSLDQVRDFVDNIFASTGAKATRYNAQSFDQAYDLLRPLYHVQYHNKLDNIVEKSRAGTAKPRDIFNLQDWYRYGDRIRLDLGPMPRRAGPERDSWIAMAANQIKKLDLGSFNDAAKMAYDDTLRKYGSPKDVKNAIRRLERTVEKHREGAFEYAKLKQRANEARGLDAIEAYLAEAGEVEARNAQARLDPTVLADTNDNVRFPPDTADRLRNKQIISNLRAGQNLPKFSQRGILD